jgi:hypothetical protein
MSSLKRGRDMDNQAWYAVLRHRRGNPDTRFTVTYPYCCTLSTLPGFDLEQTQRSALRQISPRSYYPFKTAESLIC